MLTIEMYVKQDIETTLKHNKLRGHAPSFGPTLTTPVPLINTKQ